MTTYNDDGTVASRFEPPRDSDGRAMTYAEWRERNGVPVTEEERAAVAEVNRLFDEIHAEHPRPGAEVLGPLWAAEKRWRLAERPYLWEMTLRRREQQGVPVTAEELRARALYLEIEDSVTPPWKPEQLQASNAAHERWRLATSAAFKAAGVSERP